MSNSMGKGAGRVDVVANPSRVQFTAPVGAVPAWLPVGYVQVTDPDHVLAPDDALLPALSNDWRLVGDVNDGARVGLRAASVGNDILYLARRFEARE